MEKFKHKNGMGSLFVNDKKTNDSQPSWKGTLVTPDGNEFRISGWQKTGNRGVYISLAVDQWQPNSDAPNPNPTPAVNDSGLPF